MRERLLELVDRLESIAAAQIGRLPAPLQVALTGGRKTIRDGQALAPDVQLILFLRRLLRGPELSELPPAASRERLRREARLHGGRLAEVGGISERVIEGPAGPLRARHYAPDAKGTEPLLVYFHGGGYVVGDLETHDAACRLICQKARVHVLAVDYRLAPESPFPAALDDGRAALRWAFAHAQELGCDPARIAVGGDSAGGNLAAVVSQRAAHDGGPAPAAQLLIYPALDRSHPHASLGAFADGFLLTRADIDWYQLQYAGPHADLFDPRISPLRAKDLSGLPPALIITAGFDPLRDEGEAYARALTDAGSRAELHRFAGLVHGFVNMLGPSPSARLAVAEIAVRLRALLDGLAEKRSGGRA